MVNYLKTKENSWKLVIIIFFSLLVGGVSTASDNSYSWVRFTNDSIANVNRSEYWDNYNTPYDLPALNSTSWTRNGTTIHQRDLSDNVCVGCTIPSRKLDIGGNVNIANNLYLGDDIYMGAGKNLRWGSQTIFQGDNANFYIRVGNQWLLQLNSNNNALQSYTDDETLLGLTNKRWKALHVGTGESTFGSKVNISDDLNVGGDLNISGDSYFNGKLDVQEEVEVIGSLTTAKIDSKGQLILNGTDATAAAQTRMYMSTGVGNANGAEFIMQKSRNQGFSTVVNNDELGTIKFQGADGNSMETGATINVLSKGTWTGSSRPTEISFWNVRSGATTLMERLKITDGGTAEFFGAICLEGSSSCSTPATGDLEVEDGSACIGNGGCTPPAGDGNLLIEGTLETRDINADGSILLEDLMVFEPNAQTILDNGIPANSPNLALIPPATGITVDCQDGDGCTITMTKPALHTGDFHIINCISANTCTIVDVNGVVELQGNANQVLGQYDSIMLWYPTDRWVQTAPIGNV